MLATLVPTVIERRRFQRFLTLQLELFRAVRLGIGRKGRKDYRQEKGKRTSNDEKRGKHAKKRKKVLVFIYTMFTSSLLAEYQAVEE